MTTGALPIKGTETLNILLGTALPCKLFSQLEVPGNHTAPTNSLAKHQNEGRTWCKESMLWNNKCFHGDFPATCKGRQKFCFFPASKQESVWNLWGPIPLPLSQRWSSHGNTVFLRETMTCNATCHPSKKNRKSTHVNAKQTVVKGVWGPGREKTGFWM